MFWNLAWRNLTRQKRRTLLLGSGIGLGMIMITLLSSLAQTMVYNVRVNLTESAGGHLFLTGEEVTFSGRHISIVRNPEFLKEKIKNLGVQVASFSERTSAQTVILFGSRSRALQAQGLEAEQVATLEKRLLVKSGKVGEFQLGTLILPSLIAEKLHLASAGEEVLVRTQTITGQQNVASFIVAAIADDPAALGTSSAFFRLADLNKLVSVSDGQCQTLSVSLKNPDQSETAARDLYGVLAADIPVFPPYSGSGAGLMRMMSSFQGNSLIGLGGDEVQWKGNKIRIETIGELMQPIMDIVNTLQLISSAVFVVLLVIILVGVSNTFQMVLLERVREIGTMRALGYQKSQVRTLFLSEAGLLTLTSAILGLLLGGILGVFCGSWHWDSLPLSLGIFFQQGRLGMSLSAKSAIFLVVTVTVIGLLAAWSPARKRRI